MATETFDTIPSGSDLKNTYEPVSDQHPAYEDDHQEKVGCCMSMWLSFRSMIVGVVPLPVRLIFMLLSVMQELPVTAIGHILTRDLHFGPEEISKYYAMTYTPWLFKPLYGFFADNFPILGFRRRPYVMIAAFISGFIFFAMATWAHDHILFTVLGVANAAAICCAEVMMDGISAELGNELKHKLRQREAYEEAAAAAAAEQDQAATAGASVLSAAGGEGDAVVEDAQSPTAETAHTKGTLALTAQPTPHMTPQYYDITAADRRKAASHAHGSINSAATAEEVAAATVLPDASATRADAAAMRGLDDQLRAHAAGSRYHRAHAPGYPLSQEEDDLLKEMTSKTARAAIQSECMTVRSFASLIAAGLSLIILYFAQARSLVLGMVAVCGVTIAVAVTVPELRARAVGTINPVIAGQSAVPSGASSGAAEGSEESALSDSAEETVRDENEMADGEEYPCCAESLHAMYQAESDALANPILSVGVVRPAPVPSAVSDVSDATPLTRPRIRRERMTCCSCRLIGRLLWFRIKVILRALIILIRPTIFVFVANAMPTSADSYFGYMYSFEFPNWLLSAFTFVSLLGGLLGSVLYWKIFSKISLRKVYALATFLNIIASIPMLMFTSGFFKDKLHMSHNVSVPIANFFSAIFSRVALMPTIVIAAECCPPHLGLEASMFSVYTAVSHGASYASIAISIAFIRHFKLTWEDYSNLTKFMAVCLAFTLVPLFLLPILPSQEEQERAAEAITVADLLGLPPLKRDDVPAEGEEDKGEKDGLIKGVKASDEPASKATAAL